MLNLDGYYDDDYGYDPELDYDEYSDDDYDWYSEEEG